MEKPGSGGSFLKKIWLMQLLCKRKRLKSFPVKRQHKPKPINGFMNQKLYSKFHSEKVGDEELHLCMALGIFQLLVRPGCIQRERENRVELPLSRIAKIFQVPLEP